MNSEADYRRRAHEAFDTDDVTIDADNAVVSISEDGGAWVAGWLWIDAEEPPDPDDIEAEDELDDGPRIDEDEVDEAALNRARFFPEEVPEMLARTGQTNFMPGRTANDLRRELFKTIYPLSRAFNSHPSPPASRPSPHDDGAP